MIKNIPVPLMDETLTSPMYSLELAKKVNEIVDTINELQTTLDNYTKRFREGEAVQDPRIHEAVKSANKKLDNELDIAIDALTRIENEDCEVASYLKYIAKKALNKIKELQ